MSYTFLALSVGEHSRNSDTMIFIYLQKLPRCSRTFLPFCCVALIRDNLEMKKKHPSRMQCLEYIYIPEFLKTGLAKIRAYSTTWQLKAIKSVQRPIKKPISDAEQ